MSGLLCRAGGSCLQVPQDYGARSEQGSGSRLNSTSLVVVGVAGSSRLPLPTVRRRLASRAAWGRAGPRPSGWRVPRVNPTARAAAPVSQEASAEPAVSGIRVSFVLKRACDFGQYYAVLGEPKSLGAWDPGKAAPLVWSEGNMWTVEVVVPYVEQFEFKLVLVASPTSVFWQPGPNRVLDSKGAEALRVTVPWEAEPVIVERVDAAPPEGQGLGQFAADGDYTTPESHSAPRSLGRSAAGQPPRGRSRSPSPPPPSRRFSLPSDPLWKDLVFPAAVEGDPLDVARAWLMEKTMRELRHLARERGLRGDTKVEIVNLLLGLGSSSLAAPPSPPPAPTPPPTPTPAPTPSPGATMSPNFPPATGRVSHLVFPLFSSHSTVPTPPAIPPRPAAPTPPAAAPLNGAGLSHGNANGWASAPPKVGLTAEDEENVLVQALQEKSMAELRAMGREWGLRGDTKEELIVLLVKVLTPGPTDQAAAEARAQKAAQMGLPYMEAPEVGGGEALVGAPEAVGRPWDAVFGGERGSVNGSAKSASLNGSVKEVPVKKTSDARESGFASGRKTEEELLEELSAKSMGELRAMGREHNLRGDTKGELIRLLVGVLAAAGPTSGERMVGAEQGVGKSSSNGSGFASTPTVFGGTDTMATSAKGVGPESAKSVGAVNGGSVARADERAELLQALTVGELRLLGRMHGVRGDTKEELVKLIVAAEGRATSGGGSGGKGVGEAKGSTGVAGMGGANGAAHHPVAIPSSGGVGQKEKSSTGDVEAWKETLLEKSMLELRALAREKGVRGDTRDDIIKQLVAVVAA